ncbi:MAG: glutamate-5-semialdehyde dehydrogenase [Bacteroidota bacterium]
MLLETENITSIIPALQKTHAASSKLRIATPADKSLFLSDLADRLLKNIEFILTENQKDIDLMEVGNPKMDRLVLNENRIKDLAESLLQVNNLEDPTNQILSEKILPNGLKLQKKSVALGVVGVIFEARPNVTIDVTALCIKSGNCVVLKGGSDAHFSNQALVSLIHQSLEVANIDRNAVCLLPAGREFVKEMLEATRFIDIIIPRGSESLINFVRKNSLVPTIETGAGVCHTYVHEQADLDKAAAIVINAKTTRVSVCNSLDTIVLDKNITANFLPKIVEKFIDFKVEIFADESSYPILAALKYPFLQLAEEEDFGREFLDFKCSIKTVNDFEEALEHISKYSSRHSEAIVSENSEICEKFINEVDAAAVYSNASTRFTDGGEFGLGAEIGISTQKLHARGPFALEKLVTEKWIGIGNGQIR